MKAGYKEWFPIAELLWDLSYHKSSADFSGVAALCATWDLLFASCCFLAVEFKRNACKFDYEHYSSLSDTKKIKLVFLIVAPAAKLFVSISNDIHPSHWISDLDVTCVFSLVLIKY